MIENKYNVVRLGQKEDFDSIMMLVKEHLVELSIPITENVVRYSLSLVNKSLSSDNGLIGVIGPIGDVYGYIILGIFEESPTGDDVLWESGLFLRKDKRSSSNKYQEKLIDFAKYTAKELGMKLRISFLADRPRKKAYMRLFRKLFGEPTHISYTWDPKE